MITEFESIFEEEKNEEKISRKDNVSNILRSMQHFGIMCISNSLSKEKNSIINASVKVGKC